MNAPSAAAVARLAWAAVLVRRPDRALRLLGGPVTPAGRRVARVLGARHLLQAVVEVGGGPGRVGAVVDLAHAASGVGLAVLSRRWRRAASADAVAASALGLATWRAARR